MNLVEQIFAQSKIGSGRGDASAFLQGAQLGQNQQRIDTVKQQLAMELAMQPITMTLKQQEADMNALKLNAVKEQRDFQIANEEAYQGLAAQVARDLASETPEMAEVSYWNAISKNKGLYRHEGTKTLLEDIKAGINAKVQLKTIENARRAASQDTAPMKNFGKMIELQNNLLAAEQSGDPRLIATAKRELETFQGLALPASETMTVDSKTGQVTISKGKAPNGLTVGTQTRLQEQELSNEEAMRTLGSAISGIETNPNAIGVRGVVGQAVEKAKGQLNPSEPLSTPITDTRQKASIAFSRVAPALRVDSGNMSKYELNKLEQAGDVLDPTEAPQTALTKLRNLQAVVTARQLRVLKTQGKPIDDATLRQVQGEEIAGLLQAGLLSQEEALRLYRLTKNAR